MTHAIQLARVRAQGVRAEVGMHGDALNYALFILSPSCRHSSLHQQPASAGQDASVGGDVTGSGADGAAGAGSNGAACTASNAAIAISTDTQRGQ